MPHSRIMRIIPGFLYLLFCALEILSVNGHQSVTMPPEQDYYTVAIFEHARKGDWKTDTPEEFKRKNLDYFMRAAEIAKSKGADIIAFPEYGIFPPLDRIEVKQYLEQVPDPKTGAFNPCIQKHEYFDKPMLYNLSCTARKYQIVILANMGDIQPCNNEETDNCPEDGSLHYNANVVFDRDGTIISKYHKEHLFFEMSMDLPTERQDPIFTTDFGTFASFVCFDVVFKHIVEAAQDTRVDAVFLSTMWIEMLPMLNSLQNWQGWAIGNKATIIAANAQIPGYAAIGSGVFTANLGPLIYTYNPDGMSKLIVSRVPKSKNRTEPFPNPDATILIVTDNGTEAYDEDAVDFDNYLPEYCIPEIVGPPTDIYKDYRCINESTLNYTLVKMTEPEGHLEACNNGMCCSLDYSTRGMNETFYFGVVNNTYNSYNRYFWWEEKCVVLRCEEFRGEECRIFPTKSSTVFETLKLKANFTTPTVYPSAVRTGMRPAPLTEWKHDIQRENDYYIGTLDYKSSAESKPLIVAGLNGRCFDRDPPYIR